MDIVGRKFDVEFIDVTFASDEFVETTYDDCGSGEWKEEWKY